MLFDIFKTKTETIKDFILVSALLSLVDRPLKNSVKWEDAGANEVSNLEIDADEIAESINEEIRGGLISSYFISCADKSSLYGAIAWTNMTEERDLGNFLSVKNELEKEIRCLPFRKIIEPKEGHREAFRKVLSKIIDEFKSEKNIQTSRTMTLWLLMLALDIDKGEITPNKSALIDDFRNAFEIEDDVLEDLQERAASLYKELIKTMIIINE